MKRAVAEMEPALKARLCRWCRRPFVPKTLRRHTFCTPACRQKDYRQRTVPGAMAGYLERPTRQCFRCRKQIATTDLVRAIVYGRKQIFCPTCVPAGAAPVTRCSACGHVLDGSEGVRP